jgi:hypothetical protein
MGLARTASGSAGTAAARRVLQLQPPQQQQPPPHPPQLGSARLPEPPAREPAIAAAAPQLNMSAALGLTVSKRVPMPSVLSRPRARQVPTRISSASLGAAAAQRLLKQPGVLSPRVRARPLVLREPEPEPEVEPASARKRGAKPLPSPTPTPPSLGRPPALGRTSSAQLGAAAARRVAQSGKLAAATGRPAPPDERRAGETALHAQVQAEIETLTRAAVVGGRRGGRRASLPDIRPPPDLHSASFPPLSPARAAPPRAGGERVRRPTVPAISLPAHSPSTRPSAGATSLPLLRKQPAASSANRREPVGFHRDAAPELQISEDGWVVKKAKWNMGVLTYRGAMAGPPMKSGVHSAEFKLVSGVAGVIIGVAREWIKTTSGGGRICKSEDGWGFDVCNGDLVHGAEGLGANAAPCHAMP